VTNRLGRGLRPVMTARAPCGDAGVVHLRAKERHRALVAGFA
jgi:hypothetical protein